MKHFLMFAAAVAVGIVVARVVEPALNSVLSSASAPVSNLVF
jgi:hypothetical protein